MKAEEATAQSPHPPHAWAKTSVSTALAAASGPTNATGSPARTASTDANGPMAPYVAPRTTIRRNRRCVTP